MRYIDAEELKRVKFHPLPYTHITPSDVDAESYKRGWNDAIDAIVDCQPTADVRENVRGEWIRRDSRYVGWISFDCSVCGETLELDRETSNDFKYCPFCGAEMRGDNNV